MSKTNPLSGYRLLSKHLPTTQPMALLVSLLVFGVVFSSCKAQTAPSASSASPSSKGHVIFSRSNNDGTSSNDMGNDDGQTTAQTPLSASPATVPLAAKPRATQPAANDAERKALTYTALDLDVRLRTAEQHLAVRALLTVRNDGKSPLAQIPLQISSSLDWERIRIHGKDVAFEVATINSDADHTGQLHEATASIPPLAPGASLQLDVLYSGTIPPTAQRLLALGTPANIALHSDWDQISTEFTGLRGFGNVVWYPATAVPVLLGDGAQLFDEIGEHKLRLSGTHFHLRLTVESPHGEAPTVAIVNGHSLPLVTTESGLLDQSQEVTSITSADTDELTLGFEAPSLFVAIREPHSGSNFTAWTLPEPKTLSKQTLPIEESVKSWTKAATIVKPFLEGWLGPLPQTPLTLLELPDPQDASFETGALLAMPLRESPPTQINEILLHAFTRTYAQPAAKEIAPPPAWLDEGLATFLGTLWIEKQQDRNHALESLEAARSALALAEPESPGQSLGQPLAKAISHVYYRTKAAYVLWMLRDLVGDPILATALRNYLSVNATERHSLQKYLELAGNKRGLGWFFADWIDADNGLPELSIDGIFPNEAQSGNWLVSVTVANHGYAAAEVPLIVHSATHTTTQLVLIPARSKVAQRILIQGKPVSVQLNDGTVPEPQASIHRTELNQSADDPSPPRN